MKTKKKDAQSTQTVNKGGSTLSHVRVGAKWEVPSLGWALKFQCFKTSLGCTKIIFLFTSKLGFVSWRSGLASMF